jgi:hypothetical protein
MKNLQLEYPLHLPIQHDFYKNRTWQNLVSVVLKTACLKAGVLDQFTDNNPLMFKALWQEKRLLITQELIQTQDVTIRVSSQPDQGSTFLVELPL